MISVDANWQADRLRHFRELEHADQVRAVLQLADQGLRDHDLSAATGWGVDQIRTALGNRPRL